MTRIKIPRHAKVSARKALKERNNFPDKPGLTKDEAEKKGINSGVERAKQIVTSSPYLKEGASSKPNAYSSLHIVPASTTRAFSEEGLTVSSQAFSSEEEISACPAVSITMDAFKSR